MSDEGPLVPAPRFIRRDCDGHVTNLTIVCYDTHREASFHLKRDTAYAVQVAGPRGQFLGLRDLDGGEVYGELPAFHLVSEAPADVIARIERDWMYDACVIERLDDDQLTSKR